MRNGVDRSQRGLEQHRVPPGWFDQLYSDDPDPWGFADSPYEREKYRATIRAMGGRRYASGFEAGCSIGVLTMDLSASCDRLLAVDASQIALVHARARTAALCNVTLRHAVLPEDWPAGPFDLVVLSEVGYYFDATALDVLLDVATASLQPGGDLVAVHWTPPASTPLTGEDVHDRLHARPELCSQVSQRHPTYRLDVLNRR